MRALERCGVVAVLFAAGAAAGGCVHSMRVMVPTGGDTDVRSGVVSSWFWGAVPGVMTTGCEYGVARVQLDRGFEHYLATVATLGVWSPASIEYECAQDATAGDDETDAEETDETDGEHTEGAS